MAAIAAAVVGFGALCSLPPRSWLSDAGQQTLLCYLLHVPFSPLVQSVGALESLFPDPGSVARGVAVLVWLVVLQIILARA
eukprot:2566594-Prymnesium_polylepis.1